MALPFFYLQAYDPSLPELILDEDNSRHVIQVLRMKPGELLQLTDGRGALLRAVIVDDHKKRCRVRIESMLDRPAPARKVTIAISLLKNASRFEWFIEKATEIGVSSIVPLLCERTEKQHARIDRLRGILISAMLQSQQVWLPELTEPVEFSGLVGRQVSGRRYIAHCLEAPRPTDSLADWREIGSLRIGGGASDQSGSGNEVTPQLILIGPEGDFSPREIEAALKAGFLPVTLGQNRLRTETAGVVAATLLCIE
ncbi:MAG: 16S rRNA (uracil(1498)-N(3))-methyltransferase [Bacteroidetes bacterium]|nr:16S rRNA (uracil(1498)-N(3))-methyltransferase [Bacteroidota bacterium]